MIFTKSCLFFVQSKKLDIYVIINTVKRKKRPGTNLRKKRKKRTDPNFRKNRTDPKLRSNCEKGKNYATNIK